MVQLATSFIVVSIIVIPSLAMPIVREPLIRRDLSEAIDALLVRESPGDLFNRELSTLEIREPVPGFGLSFLEGAFSKGVEKLAEKGTEKIAEKVAEKGAEKVAEKGAEKVAEKGAEKVATTGTGKVVQTIKKIANMVKEQGHGGDQPAGDTQKGPQTVVSRIQDIARKVHKVADKVNDLSGNGGTQPNAPQTGSQKVVHKKQKIAKKIKGLVDNGGAQPATSAQGVPPSGAQQIVQKVQQIVDKVNEKVNEQGGNGGGQPQAPLALQNLAGKIKGQGGNGGVQLGIFNPATSIQKPRYFRFGLPTVWNPHREALRFDDPFQYGRHRYGGWGERRFGEIENIQPFNTEYSGQVFKRDFDDAELALLERMYYDDLD